MLRYFHIYLIVHWISVPFRTQPTALFFSSSPNLAVHGSIAIQIQQLGRLNAAARGACQTETCSVYTKDNKQITSASYTKTLLFRMGQSWKKLVQIIYPQLKVVCFRNSTHAFVHFWFMTFFFRIPSGQRPLLSQLLLKDPAQWQFQITRSFYRNQITTHIYFEFISLSITFPQTLNYRSSWLCAWVWSSPNLLKL